MIYSVSNTPEPSIFAFFSEDLHKDADNCFHRTFFHTRPPFGSHRKVPMIFWVALALSIILSISSLVLASEIPA